MARLLIIGYGNPLRGDDGLGWYAAERLRNELRDPETEILSAYQLTPELAEPISRANLVVFLDARDGGVPGELRCENVEARPNPTGALSHHATPAGLLWAARTLYGSAPEGRLYSVSGACFGYGEGLSAPLEAALDELVAACKQIQRSE